MGKKETTTHNGSKNLAYAIELKIYAKMKLEAVLINSSFKL